MTKKPVVKMYSDFKSPYAFLAFKPGIELTQKYNVDIKWRPFQLRLKGKGQRSIYSEWKIKYSYMDARRHANRLYDGQMLRGPLKIFDTTPSLIGSLFAEKHNKLEEYCTTLFESFFKREFAADETEEVSKLIENIGLSKQAYLEFLVDDGLIEFESCLDEAAEDHIFGVPIFVFNGEQFWGADRLWLLEETLAEAGLAKSKRS
jgi:2-hydroxychromene-2-carboxylate isomerase